METTKRICAVSLGWDGGCRPRAVNLENDVSDVSGLLTACCICAVSPGWDRGCRPRGKVQSNWKNDVSGLLTACCPGQGTLNKPVRYS